MSKPITIFSGGTGLNTVEDPVRIPAQKNGLSDLQVAVNVSIDQSYRMNSRRGVSQLQSGSYHSLFCDGGDCFVMKGDSLYQIAEDGSLKGIRSGLTDAKMDYTQTGDRTYYTNGYEFGYVQGGTSYVWKKGTYQGPDTNRVFSGPMPGNHITDFAGRIFISQENVIWYSEPFDFGLFNKAESFVQFYTKILMMKPVASGMFVSTERGTYFLEGVNPKGWKVRQVFGYPAIEWSDAVDYVNSVDLGFEIPGLCPIWASSEGAIMGFPTGDVINLNKEKIIYPEGAKTGFGCLIGLNFIHGVK